MSFITWKPVLKPIQMFLAAFGMSMNCILLCLILFRSPKKLGIYKFLMMYISVFELFFGSFELLAVPDFWTRGSAFTLITDPTTSMVPNFILRTSTLIYCGSFGLSLAVFGIQFVYRYQVFRGNHSWTTCRPGNVFFWMGSPLVFAVCWAIVCVLYFGRNKYTDKLLMEDILPNHYNSVSIDAIGLVSVYIFPRLENGSTVVNWDSVHAMIIHTFMLISTETIMLFSGVKCYLFIENLIDLSTGSKHFRRIQSQLFYALVSQTAIPIIFIQLPISLVFGSIFLDAATECHGILLSFAIPFYLATDALPTMFIVKAYRTTILDCIRYVKRAIFFSARSETLETVKTDVPMFTQTKAYVNRVVTPC